MNGYRVVKPDTLHLRELMCWFTDEASLKIWSGPNFRTPFTEQTFLQDLQLDELNSIILVSEQHELLAFGQCYLRLGKCHLARLVIAPDFRGKGIISNLIAALSDLGMQKFGAAQCSLFVLRHNEKAIAAYIREGFVMSNYPEKMPLEGCSYMLRELSV